MNAEPYDALPGEVADNIAKAFRVPQTAKVAKRVIKDRLKELAATGELQRLSNEEAEMIAELRRFKAVTKPGGVFKWQTRPDERLIVEPPEVALIGHPQNVSANQQDKAS
jgi:hypothetical protein